MRILIAALLSVALIWLLPGKAPHLNNSDGRASAQAVQAELPRKGVTDTLVQEKAPMEQQAVSEPEQKTATNVNENASSGNIGQQDVNVSSQSPLTEHEQWMQAAGINKSDWSAVDFIITHESGWQPTTLNKEGCVGLGQRCPASTLYAQCPDLNPVCQLSQFTQYAVSRYGSWTNAASVWASQSWW